MEKESGNQLPGMKRSNETVEGGKLFSDIGENQEIEGLRKIYNHTTLIDPKQPELGPKSYQLAFIGGRGDGRTPFAGRFTKAFGTKTFLVMPTHEGALKYLGARY